MKRELFSLNDFSFPKSFRLRKRSEYLKLSITGKKAHARHFIAIYGTCDCKCSRIGITITKKIGPATTRNRIKRLIREHFRTNRNKLKGYWDINIIAKKSASASTARHIFDSLETLMNKISG